MDTEEKDRNYNLAEQLLAEQNFPVAVIAGTITMILGSGLYAVLALASGGNSISFTIIGIAAAIGAAMQFLGRGLTTKFEVAAAILSALTYPVAKLTTMGLYTVRMRQDLSIDVVSAERIAAIKNWLIAGFKPFDVLFLIVAMCVAAYLAKRRLNYDEGMAMRTYERK